MCGITLSHDFNANHFVTDVIDLFDKMANHISIQHIPIAYSGHCITTEGRIRFNMSNNKIFKYSVLIKEHHLDTFSHVNNAVYLELLEEARWEFLNAQGIDLKTIHDTGIGPIVLECHIKFLKELRLRQPIVIESQMLSFEKKIGVMRQDILDERGELCSHAKMTFGVFDMNTRKLILPTAQWLLATGINGKFIDN